MCKCKSVYHMRSHNEHKNTHLSLRQVLSIVPVPFLQAQFFPSIQVELPFNDD